LGYQADVRGVAYGQGLYVAVGGNEAVPLRPRTSTILTSRDAVIWTRQVSATTNALASVAYGNGLFVAAGGGGTIVTSADGSNWVRRSSGLNGRLRRVSSGGGRFVAVGEGGVSSDDGTNWVVRLTGHEGLFEGVGYGNGLFAVVGGLYGSCSQPIGVVLTSSDSAGWSLLPPPGSVGPLSGIAYGNGYFVGSTGGALASFDEDLRWTVRDTYCGWWLNSVAFGKDTFVAVGGGGTILQSDPVVPPPPATLKARLRAPVELELLGEPGRTYRIERAGSLPPVTTWQKLTNLTLITNSAVFADSPPRTVHRRYYRAVSLP
jgi:hypothetical protein